ncbi:MAG: hypothetical protein ATN35_03700 [Epulopiscium sp. Nele67-Bin004]|nr:MAG: hypothetical protein ATN35_03700 [Epulopiscium sp. Nele67-Bin004]
MIQIENLNYSVMDGESERKILNNISAQIKSNSLTVVHGTSGSGKTTLLYALSGMLDNIDSGKIVIDGTSLYALDASERDNFRLKNMGLVFQNFNLFPSMSIEENIFLPIYANNQKPTAQQKFKAKEFMGMLNLVDCVNKPIFKLSGGQQQRVAIIRAFITNPAIILCDEPTANLDVENSKIFYSYLQKISKAEDCAIVVVSHDTMALEYCDDRIKIIDGKII